MRKILLLFTLIIGTLLALTACGNKDLTKVKLNEVTHSVFYAPQYVALSQGYFEDEGLKIDVTNGKGADKVMTAVLSNQSDIGFAGPEAAVYVHNEGKKNHAVVFAQLTKRDGSFLMGRKPDPDFKWSDVKGKTIIGGREGGVPEMTLEYVLKKHGITPGKDVHINTSIQFALMPGAFTSGQGDYVTLFEPTASIFEKKDKGHVVASIGKESGEIPYTAYFAKESYIKNNPEIIQKFTNAVYKGQLWVDAHTPKQIAKAIKPHFPDTKESILVSVAERYKRQDTWAIDPILEEKSLNHLQDIIEMADQLDKRAPYDEIVDTLFAEKAVENINSY